MKILSKLLYTYFLNCYIHCFFILYIYYVLYLKTIHKLLIACTVAHYYLITVDFSCIRCFHKNSIFLNSSVPGFIFVSEHAEVYQLQRHGAQRQYHRGADDDRRQGVQHAGKRQRRREPCARYGQRQPECRGRYEQQRAPIPGPESDDEREGAQGDAGAAQKIRSEEGVDRLQGQIRHRAETVGASPRCLSCDG